jgi:hypothetical protein
MLLSSRPHAGPVRAAIGADADQVEGLHAFSGFGREVVFEQHDRPPVRAGELPPDVPGGLGDGGGLAGFGDDGQVAAGLAHGSPPRDRRASGAVGVGPFILDQAPVPGEQDGGCHDPVQPQMPGQQPRERGDHGRAFPPGAASLLPGLLAATPTGLTPASDDELTNAKKHHGITSRCHLPLCWAHE